MSSPRSNGAPGHLFAYGTLLPGEPRWHFLQPFVVDEGVTDAVRGALFDTGEGYPAAVFESAVFESAGFESAGFESAGFESAGFESAGFEAGRAVAGAVILGRVFELVADRLDEALAVVDEVEGAVDGRYHRVAQATLAGRAVWTYQYGGGLELRPIVSGSWSDRG